MLAKIILLCAFSVQVLCDAVYSTIPEVPVPEVEHDWLNFVFFEMIKNPFVVVVTDYCILIYA